MDIQDTIDAYVKGQLKAGERKSFEKKMENDPALAEAVEQARFDLAAANLLLRDELRDWMQQWKADTAPPTPPESPPPAGSPFSYRRFVALIAAIALVAALAAFWFLQRSNSDTAPAPATDQKQKPSLDKPAAEPESQPAERQENRTAPLPAPPPPPNPRMIALAKTNFQTEPPQTFIRGAGDSPAPERHPLDTAAALAAKNDRGAIALAQQVPSTDERYADALLFLGQVYFQTQQFARAENAFRGALATGNIPPDQAQWNLLMCLLAQYPGKKAAFDALLMELLADKNHGFYRKAELLKAKM